MIRQLLKTQEMVYIHAKNVLWVIKFTIQLVVIKDTAKNVKKAANYVLENLVRYVLLDIIK